MNWETSLIIGIWIGLILGMVIWDFMWRHDFFYDDKIYSRITREREEARARRRAKYEEKLRKVQ